jgi:tetratricopeptide (TPR) repeat protein
MSGSKRVNISGVFSSQTQVSVGTGTTTRKAIQKTYWFAEENERGEIYIQPLNRNYVPAGKKQQMGRDEFLDNYTPEPEFYNSTVYPKMKELNTSVQRGEAHRTKSEAYSAEYEFNHALNFDEQNVRANFGLGLTYLERGNVTKADDIFKRLVNIEATFKPEHKHLFNDFGISLRKNGMIDQALEYYHKAEELTENDENLYMNIARAYFEKGDFKQCYSYLKKSLALNPEMEEAGLFWLYLKDNGYILSDAEDIPGFNPPERKKRKHAIPVEDFEIDF